VEAAIISMKGKVYLATRVRRGWKTAGYHRFIISDLLERSEEVPLDVIVVHKADQVVALLNLL